MDNPTIDDEKLLFGDSDKSSDVLDHCLLNDHPPVRTEHLLSLANQDYMEKIRELNDRLEMVKNIVKPGCSYEVLNTALSYMSSLATILSTMPQKPHASL